MSMVGGKSKYHIDIWKGNMPSRSSQCRLSWFFQKQALGFAANVALKVTM